jgi:hypothetical protein
MTAAAKILADALALPESEREDLAALLLDSIEPPPGISIDDEHEIRRRAQAARDGEPMERGEAGPREVILFRPEATCELADDVRYYEEHTPAAANASRRPSNAPSS